MKIRKRNLNVRGEKRELQGPSKLNARGDGAAENQIHQAGVLRWRRRVRRSAGRVRVVADPAARLAVLDADELHLRRGG